jgi:hypothetical protein
MSSLRSYMNGEEFMEYYTVLDAFLKMTRASGNRRRETGSSKSFQQPFITRLCVSLTKVEPDICRIRSNRSTQVKESCTSP